MPALSRFRSRLVAALGQRGDGECKREGKRDSGCVLPDYLSVRSMRLGRERGSELLFVLMIRGLIRGGDRGKGV